MPSRKPLPCKRATGLLFVLSGPSGSGKTTLAQAVLKAPRFKRYLARSISFTTRPRRRGERNARDYFFVSEKEFRRLRAQQKILEWTRYLGYYYGTAKDFVDKNLRQGKSLVLCLDVRGARRVKKLYPASSITVFIMPPSRAELMRRLTMRARETQGEEIHRRLRVAESEMRAAQEFDFCLVNKDLARAIRELKAFVCSSLQA